MIFFKYSVLTSGGVPPGDGLLGMLKDNLFEGELVSDAICVSDLDAGDTCELAAELGRDSFRISSCRVCQDQSQNNELKCQLPIDILLLTLFKSLRWPSLPLISSIVLSWFSASFKSISFSALILFWC
jgi:hypothetical protein